MDIFDERGIKPMLIAKNQPPFNHPDYIFEIKFDGTRCIAYLDRTTTDLRNKRDKKLTPIIPELADLHKYVDKRCVLDGELIVMVNGEPNFYEMQRRSLMSDPFKIGLAADKCRVTFVVYDLLYLDDKLMIDLPLMERKHILEATVRENEKAAISRYVENDGIKLFTLTKEKQLEGIVAKRKDSKYKPGKRTDLWMKCKHLETSDCVICGYITKENNITSLVLGQYEGTRMVYRGHVTFLGGAKRLLEFGAKKTDTPPFTTIAKGNEEAVWLEPSLVCIVESMPTEKNSFRQPVFRGIRDDKLPQECLVEIP